MKNSLDLTISIVNWNGQEFILDFLTSIYTYTKGISFEIFVVDNASTDTSCQQIEMQFPYVKIIRNRENVGYARAHNQALQKAQGRFVVFLNLDMRLVENSFAVLVDYMDTHLNIAACTPMLIYGDHLLQPNVKHHPTLLSQVFVLLKIHIFFKNCSVMREYLAKDFDYQKEQSVEQIMGACVCARREFIQRIGGWGNAYPFWFEDLDMCKKIQRSGGIIMYIPYTTIVHYESQSAKKQLSVSKQIRFNKGLLQYFKTYHNFFSYCVLLLLYPVSIFLAWLTQVFKFQPRSQARHSK